MSSYELDPDEWQEARETTYEDIIDVFERWSRPHAHRDPRFITISGAIKNALQTEPNLVIAVDTMIRTHHSPIRYALFESDEDLLDSEQLRGPKELVFSQSHSLTGFNRVIPYPEYGANLLHRGFWHTWRMTKGSGWPDDFDSEEHVQRAIKNVLENQEVFSDFVTGISWFPVQTSYPDRMLGPLITLKAFEDRFPRGMKMVSVGHSWGSGERKELLGIKFPTPQVFDWEGYSPHVAYRRDMTDQLRELLRRPSGISNIYGVDIFPGDLLPEAGERAISSLLPGEQMNKPLMTEIEMLKNSTPEGYVSLRGDFAARSMPGNLEEKMSGKADIVLFSTIWYQLPHDQREIMLKNAVSLLNDDGLVFVLDFARKKQLIHQTGNPVDNLYFPRDWAQWTYRMHVLDLHKSGRDISQADFEEAMMFVNGRCNAVHFSEEYKLRIFNK